MRFGIISLSDCCIFSSFVILIWWWWYYADPDKDISSEDGLDAYADAYADAGHSPTSWMS